MTAVHAHGLQYMLTQEGASQMPVKLQRLPWIGNPWAVCREKVQCLQIRSDLSKSLLQVFGISGANRSR
eukprot:4124840-Amphidinium_carterae.1